MYYYLKPNDSPAPSFYGQQKIHKPEVPIRNIVSYSGFPLYNLSKYIAFLKLENAENESNNAKNSITFSNFIKNVPIEDDEIMVSFDVTFLYTNIPIIDRLNIINDYVKNDDQFTRKTAIPQEKFFDLTCLDLTATCYTFNSHFYQETDGSVLGPLLFLIFINDLPDGITSLCKIFADDTSLFSKVYDIDISAKELNSDLENISKWAFQWKMQFNPDPNKQANEVYFSKKNKKQFSSPCCFQ